nr:DegV family EDD domain-containing protein [Butyrivibrio sp.]
MGEYVLSCCSTADLTKEYFENRNISYICFHYQLDGVDYMDDLGQSMSFPEFYKAMQNGSDTKTSQINVEEYVKYFETFLKNGQDVLHLTLSSGISGTINSAMMAKEILEDQYRDRKIYIVDSLSASSGYGLLVDKLADLRDEGK